MNDRAIRAIVVDPSVSKVYEKYLNPSGRKLRDMLGGKPESVFVGAVLPRHSMWILHEDLWPRERRVRGPTQVGLPLWGLSSEHGALEVPLFGVGIIYRIVASRVSSTDIMTEDVEKLVAWPERF